MKSVSPALAALLRGELPSLSSPAAWDSLARGAMDEGVAPLAFWILSTAGSLSALPPSARRTLRESYFRTWRRNQEIFGELESFARAFQTADVPFVVLKGACFALTLYPDVGVRPMGDLDLLVPPLEWEGCVKMAKTLGYEETQPEALPGLRAALAHEISLRKKSAPAIFVEIHRSLVGSQAFRYAAPMDWFWEQTRPLNDPRFPGALTLSPAAQTLYAAAHAVLQHGESGAPLRWFADIDRLIRAHADEAFWETALRQAQAFEWDAALNAALRIARETFATPVPQSVLNELAESANRSLTKKRAKEMETAPLTRTLAELRKASALTLGGKMRLMLALAFPSPAYMRWRYGLKTLWLLPISYLRRWRSIATDGLRTALALLKKVRFL